MKTKPYTVEATGPNVTTLRFAPGKARSEYWLLITADQHMDHPLCRRDMLARHYREAVDRGAAIIIPGDLLCVMQGKYDKRADKRQIAPGIYAQIMEGKPYLDAVVEDAAAFLEPYAENIVAIGDGNHEASIYERHETDLLERLCSLLRSRTKSKVQHTGYTGWLRMLFTCNTIKVQRRLWYMHGYGGGGPVTQDMIQAQRQRAYIHGADIMVNGHTHDAWQVENIAIVLNQAGTIEHRRIFQIKTATYKDEYRTGRGGWHVATGKPPKPLGGWWVRFWFENDELKTDITRAH